jgi:hypothetical protein
VLPEIPPGLGPPGGVVVVIAVGVVIWVLAILAISVALSTRPTTPVTGAVALSTVSARAAAVRLAVRLRPAAFLIAARPDLPVRDHILGGFVLCHTLATLASS